MKCLIVLSALVAAAVAAPGFYHGGFVSSPSVYKYNALPYAAAPVAYTAPIAYAAPVAVESQYHAQDALGQFTYGYNGGLSAKQESRGIDGSVAGAYSYVDNKGEVQNVQYTADAVNGFRVAASNLPVGPVAEAVEVKDTVEVAKAKADFFNTFEEVKNRKVDEYVTPVVAAPVKDTVEVAEAKAKFFETFEEVKNRKADDFVAAPLAYAAPAYTAYSAPAYTAYSAPAYTAYAAPAFTQYSAPAFTQYAAKGYAYSAPAYYPYKSYAYPEVKSFAYAAPAVAYSAAPVVAPVAPIATAVTSQFHAQDELGQYSYGYNGGLSAKSETKSFDGVTRGAYSYVDANNAIQSVQYTADAVNGFRVAASNLPVAPIAPAFETVADTQEVSDAKAEHFAAHVEAKERFAKAL